MEIQVSRIIITVVNFALLYFILRHFFFKPVNDALDKRQNSIIEKMNRTEEDMKKAEALKSENERKLSEAKSEGKVIVENYKQKAEKVSEDILTEARKEAEAIIQRARVESDRVKDKTASEIREQAVDLAIMISNKALAEAISEEQHRKLIKDFIVKVGI